MEMMNVAILHYHLRRGGVSSVVLGQAEALLEEPGTWRVALVSGSYPERHPPCPIAVVPGLDYGTRRFNPGNCALPADGGARALADAIDSALREVFPGGCDLIHVHNPLIRKNPCLGPALAELRRRGHRLLVQVHDFAEDFRPDVYDADYAYPEDCDYAVINSRDRDNLVAAGLEPERIHLLPNPLSLSLPFEPRIGMRDEGAAGRRTILYPVRAIRRKNLGETLLLARYLPGGSELAVTLPPSNPRDLPAYEGWKALGARLGSPVRFEAGLDEPLAGLFGLSARAVTTSVKEGFGYSFLEPAARGIPLVGREIPYVVRDFREAGIALPGLYRQLAVPTAALPEEDLRQAMTKALTSLAKAYGATLGGDREAVLSRLGGRFSGELADFGALPEGLQRRILDRLHSDRGFEAEFLSLNPFLPGLFETWPAPEEAARWRSAIGAEYSMAVCARKLEAAYESATANDAKGAIDRRILLERFLSPESFFLSAS